MKQKFNITGMTCSACSAHVEKSVSHVDGVTQVSVNLLQNSMNVEYDEKTTDQDRIIRAVESGGYGASPASGSAQAHRERRPDSEAGDRNGAGGDRKEMRVRLAVSIAFLIPLMYVSMGHMMGLKQPAFLSGMENAVSYSLTQLLLVLPVMYVNRKFYHNGFRALFHRAPNMDSLIAIGSGAAFVYGVFAIYRMGYGLGVQDMELVKTYHMDLYFESVSMILTLITVGKYLEARSKGKTSDAIRRLMELAPEMAVVERDGTETEIALDEVVEGDIVLVRSGGKVPVDGIIIEGFGTFDESSLTGESIPVERAAGDKVLSATISKGGFVRFRATGVGENTTLSQIIRLVEDASASKAPIAKLADKIAGIFVPVVILIAAVAAVVWLLLGYGVEFAMSAGIAVLVISCPCALGLATPTAIMVGTGKGAELGILIKSAESLEMAHKIQTIVLDKTGTVTKGHPKVTDIIEKKGSGMKADLLTAAGSLEKLSEHPLSGAILEYAADQQIDFLPVEEYRAIPGEGIEGKIKGVLYCAGNRKMMHNRAFSLTEWEEKEETLSREGKTVLYFADNNGIIGMIAVADEVKETSRAAIQEMGRMGMEVVMLTGDNRKTAEAVQQKLGISRVIAEVLPQDKEREIRSIQESGKKVAMVGDGINDAPALMRADVGIAIGAGTDIAIESADIVLMHDDLMDVVNAVRLSKAVIRNIRQNLFWAFFYNTCGIPLAAGVFYPLLGWKLNPMFGAAAMSLSSVFVVSNALRLRLFRTDGKSAKDRGYKEAVAAEGKSKKETHRSESECCLTQDRSCAESSAEMEMKMNKVMIIDGMVCEHCKARVEKALNAMEGVTASVDLEQETATVEITGDVSEQSLIDAVSEAGYTVASVS